jgi:cell division topological specificity factor
MGFFDYFRRASKSAAVAKDRLQIIVARERVATRTGRVDYLPQLQQELLQVISKYEKIDLGQVTIKVDATAGCEVLELNIVLSEPSDKPQPSQTTTATTTMAESATANTTAPPPAPEAPPPAP